MQRIDLDEGLDPLSASTSSSVNRKGKMSLEEQLQNQEQNMLRSQGSTGSGSAGGFVIKKSADYNPQLDKLKFSGGNSQQNTPFGQASNNSASNSDSNNPFGRKATVLDGNSSPGPRSGSMIFGQPQTPTPKGSITDEQIPLNEDMADVANSNKMATSSSGLSEDEVLPGEILKLKANSTVYPMQFPKLSTDGYFMITNYKLLFKPHQAGFYRDNKLKSDYFQIPLGFFLRAEKKSDSKNVTMTFMEIYSKDGRSFRLKFNSREIERVQHILQSYTAIERKEEYFAFDFFKHEKAYEEKYRGWRIYDIVAEFHRQGIDAEPTKDMLTNTNSNAVMSQQYKFKYVDNRAGRICTTYPPLLVVPAKIKDNVIIRSSQFRARERLPVLTFYCKSAGTYMFRSAQSKPGIYSNRSMEDEYYLQFLGNPDMNESNPNAITSDINLQIYDARPYLSALANRAHGKGYEDTKNYKNCEISFMQIENIHHVREAHKKLMNLCFNPELNNRKWLSNIESSDWLDMISLILSAGVQAAQTLVKGKNVLVHCSDGWDRTAQIAATAELLIDPYYRTIEGFEVLMEKEFLSFGFQSQIRNGLGMSKEKDDQRSPILLQFLDCMHQIVHQFPFAFEFNLKFLQDIHFYSHSSQFGTFLNNNWLETDQSEVRSKTVSLWSFMNSKKEEYINPYYGALDVSHMKMLKPNTSMKFMRLWEEHYLFYSPLVLAPYHIDPAINFFTDFHTVLYTNEKKKNAELEKKLAGMELELQKLKHQAQAQETKIPKHNIGDNDNVDSENDNGNTNGEVEAQVDGEPKSAQKEEISSEKEKEEVSEQQ